MKRKLYLRIDIDSYQGLTKGVPKLLKLFKKLNVKATFFLTLGREGNIYEYLKYKAFRKNNPNKIEEFPNSRLKKFRDRKYEIFKILFFPSLLYKQKNIIKMISDQGHDLEIHCFNHVKWYNPNYKEAKEDLEKAIKIFKKISKSKPIGFAPPYFSWNNNIEKLIKKSPFKYICIDNGQNRPTIHEKTKKLNIPTTLSFTDKKIPICEYFARKGLRGNYLVKESLKYIEKEARKKDFLSIYIHPRIEGIELFKEFAEFLKELSEKYKIDETYSSII